jgi:tetratricopeptide (TPR) repeat protein
MVFILNRRVHDPNEPQALGRSDNCERISNGSAEPAHTDPAQINHRMLGDNHRDRKQWRDAAEAYTRHLELYPNDDAIWIQCGNCLKEAGDFARSLAAYKKAEQLNATNFEVHLQLGHLNKITGRLYEALQCYEQAALFNPNFGEAKQEIKNILDRVSSSHERTPAQIKGLFHSIDQLIAFLKLQTADDDVFASYFRLVSGR